MIAQFFEVETRPGHRDQYLNLAASLKPDLEAMGGCLFIDRFRSLTREDLLLSYQIWQDEGALTAWRVHGYHHEVQTIGRAKVFSDYRIRIAQVIHEARPGQPTWQPERRTPYNDPARRQPAYVMAVESKSARLAVETGWRRDAFASVYRDGYFAHLIDLPDDQSLETNAYPYYTQFAGKMPLFIQVEGSNYAALHMTSGYATKYWTMPELYNFALNKLHVNYMFWMRIPKPANADAYDWFDALPVIAAHPALN